MKSNKEKTFIYSLSDPRTNMPRYIGKALDCSNSSIGYVIQGRRPTMRGFGWKFADKEPID